MPDAPAAREPVGAAAIGIAGLLSLAVAMGVGRFAFTPMLPLMIQDGQLDVAAGGWLAAANYLGYLAGALSAARLGFTATRLATVALALTAVLAAAMALPLPAWGWAALRFVAGMASAWTFVSTGVWCLGALAERARGGPSPWSTAAYAGVGAGIALTGLHLWAAGSLGLAPAWLWLQLSALALVLAWPALRVMRQLPAHPMGRAPVAPGGPAAATLPPGTRGMVWSYGIFGFGYILPATFLPVLARSLVPDPRLFGLAWPLFGATAVASVVLAVVWLRHATRLQVWATSQGLMGLGVLLPSLVLSGWSIALSALLVGGTFMVATLAGIQEMRARAGAGAPPALAVMTSAFALGQIAGPLVSSALLRWTPLGEARALDLALQIGAATLFASTAWLWRMDRKARP